MSLAALPLALAALVPVMIGPLPAQHGPAALTAALCNGGTISIPLRRKAPVEDPACHPKGCHAGTCREDKSGKLISRKDVP
ncbi:hypothetical protein ACLBKU_01720 [Erythrobacter sp. NE805]|uniref:hypothetical protein n=1 Tax=Erythrobacter sp. NE805 TaxID=3389875 RepID=UPI00396B3892